MISTELFNLYRAEIASGILFFIWIIIDLILLLFVNSKYKTKLKIIFIIFNIFMFLYISISATNRHIEYKKVVPKEEKIVS